MRDTPTVEAESKVNGIATQLRRYLPVLVLLALAAVMLGLGLHRYLSLDTIRQHRLELLQFVDAHWLLALAAYLALYALLVALSLPGAAIMTISGGFLFGLLIGALAASLGATLGACVIFLIARSALAPWLKRRAGPWLGRIEAGFEENAFFYILTLRLVPVFPFFIVNLVTPFVGVPFRVYAAATYLGIMPACFVYASFGAGLGAIFDRNDPVSLDAILTPQILGGLTGLGLLALLPALFKAWRRRRGR
jgi:uncharacterized membrane protein YdjX (TVP38/TMEM64 family)